jgi:hypothetical protein
MRTFGFVLVSLPIVVGCNKSALPPEPGLVVHEWGTYTSVQGSNGATLDGMQHEEEALPSFVHQRATVPTSGKGIEALPQPVNQKLETPVLYFYSPKALTVQATVDFPGGIISQWYPDAAESMPPVGGMTAIANGRMRWNAELRPLDPMGNIQTVSADSVWAPSRQVAAVPVAIGSELEKFIFYRGLGKFDVPFRVEARADGLVDLVNDSDDVIEDVFLLRVHAEGGAAVSLGRIPAHDALRGVAPPVEGKERNLDQYVADTMTIVADALERTGLYHDEARAMVETWSRSYFRGLGLRVLYTTPRAWTDRLLPLTLSPTPGAIVRTLVGRVEIMTPADEADLRLRAAQDDTAALLGQLGRFAEPKLRRVRQLTMEPALVARLDAAIAAAAGSP